MTECPFFQYLDFLSHPGLMSQEIYYYLILLSFFGRSNYIFDSHLLLSNYDERARAEIQKVFATVSGIEKVFFPEKSGQIPDRAALTLIILPPEQAMSEGKKINDMIETFTRENGTSSRTFKSALIWIVPDSSSGLYEDARKLLAWEDISDENL
jgi:hypothetical protein